MAKRQSSEETKPELISPKRLYVLKPVPRREKPPRIHIGKHPVYQSEERTSNLVQSPWNHEKRHMIPGMPMGMRLVSSVEDQLVKKFQEYGERMLTFPEMNTIATSIAVSPDDKRAILFWLKHWIPKMAAKKAEKSGMRQFVRNSESETSFDERKPESSIREEKIDKKSIEKFHWTELLCAIRKSVESNGIEHTDPKPSTSFQRLATCFELHEPLDKPEHLSADLRTWSVDDVLAFIDHTLTPLPDFCAEQDKNFIRKYRLDGRYLYELAADDSVDFESYGLTSRAYVNLKFRCRHIINTFNGC